MTRPSLRLLVVCTLILGTGVFAGWVDLWSGSTAKPMPAQAAQGPSMAESLEQAFIRVAQDVGPAVVSISTEQIEQVQRYFRGHPFFGQEPFDEFFRDFFGDAPYGGGPERGSPQEFKRFGLGSGVIIDERGLILTNEHVVADADKITVTLADGREFSGTVKGKDVRSDLAVIKIDAKHPPVARLGNSDTLKTGQWAVAIGNPFGLVGAGARNVGSEPTLTVGIISALHRHLPRLTKTDRDYSDLIQTDAAINPGNSGGPLVNLQGEVIGINVAIISGSAQSAGIGFAIPANKAKGVLDALIEGRKVLYGWLGVQIQDITQDVADFYGLPDREGVLIYQVLTDGPAQKAGLKDGDIVKAFDGHPVKNSRELVDVVGRTTVGRKASLEILRDGKRQTVAVEVGERPTEEELAEGGAAEAWRGLLVAELNPQLAERFGLSPDAAGVIVTEVEPNSPADESHVQPGDVINEINRMPIGSLTDYRQAIANIQGNALVRTHRGYVVVKAAPSR
ncbi:MAG: Do family serine endopeptidase [Candidatus Omnitrophica bacterium]|nr:Do family serine endopeptidase [Candidatus Omnitrophota bacterium]